MICERFAFSVARLSRRRPKMVFMSCLRLFCACRALKTLFACSNCGVDRQLEGLLGDAASIVRKGL